VTPGINGPTSATAIKNADDNLKQLQDALSLTRARHDMISWSRRITAFVAENA
jgi:hypothetical protein